MSLHSLTFKCAALTSWVLPKQRLNLSKKQQLLYKLVSRSSEWCNTEALGAPTLSCLPVEKLINVATLPGGSSLYLDLLFLSL